MQRTVTLRDGSTAVIRPVEPEDAELLVDGVRGAQRPQPLRPLPHRRAAAARATGSTDLVDLDHRDREALGALDPETGAGRRRRPLRPPRRRPARRRSSRSRSPTRGRAAGSAASCSASSSRPRARTGCCGSPATSSPRTTRMLALGRTVGRGRLAGRRARRRRPAHRGALTVAAGDAPSVRLRVRLTPRAAREQVTLRPDGIARRARDRAARRRPRQRGARARRRERAAASRPRGSRSSAARARATRRCSSRASTSRPCARAPVRRVRRPSARLGAQHADQAVGELRVARHVELGPRAVLEEHLDERPVGPADARRRRPARSRSA